MLDPDNGLVFALHTSLWDGEKFILGLVRWVHYRRFKASCLRGTKAENLHRHPHSMHDDLEWPYAHLAIGRVEDVHNIAMALGRYHGDDEYALEGEIASQVWGRLEPRHLDLLADTFDDYVRGTVTFEALRAPYVAQDEATGMKQSNPLSIPKWNGVEITRANLLQVEDEGGMWEAVEYLRHELDVFENVIHQGLGSGKRLRLDELDMAPGVDDAPFRSTVKGGVWKYHVSTKWWWDAITEQADSARKLLFESLQS